MEKNPDRKVDLTDNICGLSGSGRLLINSTCWPLQIFPSLRQQGTWPADRNFHAQFSFFHTIKRPNPLHHMCTVSILTERCVLQLFWLCFYERPVSFLYFFVTSINLNLSIPTSGVLSRNSLRLAQVYLHSFLIFFLYNSLLWSEVHGNLQRHFL